MSRSEELRPLVHRRAGDPGRRARGRRAAVPLARALVAGGLKVIEVTLRTGAAIDAIERIAARSRARSSAPAPC